MDAYDISASALSAQRMRMDIIASNLANVNSTQRADGEAGPYRRKNVVFSEFLPAENNDLPFQPGRSSSAEPGVSIGADGTVTLKAGIKQEFLAPNGVEVSQVIEDTNTPMRRVHDPGHPDADEDGYVNLPNINPVTELVDMISASRAYEASVTALQSTKAMDKAALDI